MDEDQAAVDKRKSEQTHLRVSSFFMLSFHSL